MRGKKNIWKLLVLPALVMCLVLPPAAAFAGVTIGTSTDITSDDKVYFGRYPQRFNNGDGTSTNLSGIEGVDYVKAQDNSSSGGGAQKYYLRDPIEWRVLQKEDGKLFLLSEKNLDSGIPYHTADTSVTWETSTIRSWLNGYGANDAGDSAANPYPNSFIDSAFLAKESGAITKAAVTNPDNPEYDTSGGDGTTDKIFFLSIQEATSADLGFKDDNARVSVNTDYTATRNSDMFGSSDPDFWWLRSPGPENNRAAIVLHNGIVDYSDRVLDSADAVRPAFFLNLSSVLFTSAAKGGKAATIGSGLVGATAPTGDIKLKFTVTDSSQALDVNTSNMPQSGATLAFPYSNATPGENQFVSCVLEQEGAVKYYGKLVDSSSTASGTLSVPLAGVANGTYTLKIFSEQANDDYLTDYASEPVVMNLVVNKTVSVSTQTGTLTAGTAGSAAFTVTTAGIANNSAIALTDTNNVPGIALALATTATTGDSTAVTVTTTAATPQGTHPLTLTIDGVASNSFNLVVTGSSGGGGGGGGGNSGGGSSSGGSSSGGGSSSNNDNTGGGTDTPVVTVDTATDPEAPAVVVTLPEVSVGYDQATGTATVPAAEIDAAIDQAIATAAASGEEVSEIKIVVPDVAGATTV
ncbi:MAG: DUF6273 domain-containing protein, partial [Synergistaceae bacterium]|nr:DUF6273 domain-containing protein [Synergistaceae bacterium]